MPHLYAICKLTTSGRRAPDVDFVTTPVTGYALAAGPLGGYGLYLFGGSGAQLTALNALANVIGLVAMSSSETIVWSELDNIIAPAVMTKLNNFITARGWNVTVPVGVTYRAVLVAIWKKVQGIGDGDEKGLLLVYIKDLP